MAFPGKEHVVCKNTEEDTERGKVHQVRLETKHLAKAQRKDLLGKEIRVVVIGKTGVGKSSLCNAIANEIIFESKMSVKSVTQTSQWKSITCPKENDKKLVIIDTPGMFSQDDADPEEETKRVKDEIQRCIEVGAPGLHAILLLFKVGRFTNEDRKMIDTYKTYFGEENFKKHVIVVFTHSDLLPDHLTLRSFVEESKDFKGFLEKEVDSRYVSFTAKGTTENSKTNEVDHVINEILKHRYKTLSNTLFREAEEIIEKQEDQNYDKIIQEKTDNLNCKKSIEELLNEVKAEVLEEISKLRNSLRDKLIEKPFPLTLES